MAKDIYNGRYSDRVEFSFAIKNNESKDVKGIKGVLKIQDLFGNSIMNLNKGSGKLNRDRPVN